MSSVTISEGNADMLAMLAILREILNAAGETNDIGERVVDLTGQLADVTLIGGERIG